MVYVLNIDGKPLMPTERYGKVRRLLKEGKANVIKYCPFTIQLLYRTKNVVQDIVLGIDTGSKTVGVSAVTKSKEVYSGEIELRNNIVKLISIRREHRRSRRNRKTRYRKPKHDNRKVEKGWLSPAVKHKIETHISIINNVHKILPISKIIIEIANFDIQKMKNPNIKKDEYCKGEQYGFWNTREYVLWRDNYTCRYCLGKTKDKILNVHHIQSRQTGGNTPDNLITLCKTCHENLHKGDIKIDIKRKPSYKDAAFMGIMKHTLYNKLKEKYQNVEITYGYITKAVRIENNMNKAHYIDARCITGNPTVKPLGHYYKQIKIRRHNRQLHKNKIEKDGKRKLANAPYEVFGFRNFDRIKYKNTICFIFGRRIRGFFDIRLISGEIIAQSASYKKIKLVEKAKSFITERIEQDEQFIRMDA